MPDFSERKDHVSTSTTQGISCYMFCVLKAHDISEGLPLPCPTPLLRSCIYIYSYMYMYSVIL